MERLYGIEGLSFRRKRRKKRMSHLRVVRDAPRGVNERWSMDFSLTGERVAGVLDRRPATRGLPAVITVDNGGRLAFCMYFGPEFAGQTLDARTYQKGIKLHFVRPGKPVENAYIESFNGKFRNECLNEHWFITMAQARAVIERWRIEYNTERPHSSLENRTPEEYAQRHRQQVLSTADSNSGPY